MGLLLFQEQLIEEFEEETGLTKENIYSIEPYCLIFDNAHGVYDICCKIRTNGLIKDLIDKNQKEEYKNIEIINLKNIRNKIAQNTCVPTSRIILNNLE